MLQLNPDIAVIHPAPPWDMAGRDGRAVAKQLFGDRVDQLAAFQSLEITFEGEPCGVLRLCDRNFRISYPGPLDKIVQSLNRNVWIQQFPWLASASVLSQHWALLNHEITVRPPHRMTPFPNNRAVPVQINSVSFLLWKRNSLNTRNLEIHGDRLAINLLLPTLKQHDSAIKKSE